MKMLIVLGCLMMVGCTSFGAHRMFEGSDDGFVMLAGDAEGIRAYNDGLVGHITEAKSSADIKSAYWQTREQETQAKVFKFKANQKQGGAK